MSADDCLAGRLFRPVPLPANRNCVVEAAALGAAVKLLARAPETDALVAYHRQLTQCARAESSLAAHFPEVRQLGANSGGLGVISGAAHTALAILQLRQAVLSLLSDLSGLQASHEDEESIFDLEQLGKPRELLDLLKLAYHSSSGAEGGGAFSKLWSLIDALMKPEDDDDALELPAPFKALPRLLRDDALVHLKREMKATATLQSLHPLSGVQLGTDQAPPYKLTLAGAAQLTIQLDQRSELNGTAHLLFTADERGEVVLGRFDGVAAAGGWKNIKVPASDTVYVRARGSVLDPGKKGKKLWGFRVRITVDSWMPPAAEAEGLETPLAIGWQLLELLCSRRPAELLTLHTFRMLTNYLHSAAAPHRDVAAKLLLRLLRLPAAALPDADADPRASWSMRDVLALMPYVDAATKGEAGVDRVSGLLPPHIQLFAELVAQAHLRSPPPVRAQHPPWVHGLVDLSAASAFVRQPSRGAEPLDPMAALPGGWLAQIQQKGCDVLQLAAPVWERAQWGFLVKFAAKKIGGPKGELLALSPRSLPAPGDRGPIGGSPAALVQARFALLQVLNEAIKKYFKFAFSGYDGEDTLGGELCGLRVLLFPEVKQAAWAAALDATARVQEPKWIKENPPPVVIINRHRATRERADRRGRMKHSIFKQLHEQLAGTDRQLLKRRDRAFKVKFAGEGADDYGGPYREVFTMLCSELQNEDVLPLLLTTPNGQHNHGSNRDKFVCHPASTSAELLALFEFVGVLMAIALLQKETVLGLNLCSVVWKQLVQQTADASDLAAFDEMVNQSLYKIEHIEDEGIDEDLFADLIFEVFTVKLSDDTEAPLCDGGEEMDVTWHNRKRYCDMVRAARLREGRAQAHAVLRGISSMLPARLLPLFSWHEFELMACGAPDVDIDVLKAHTKYGVTVDPHKDPHIKLLWQVLEAFTGEQRSLFLTFIWGRNRLPTTDDEWGDQCMKIHTLETPKPDGHFPVSHTCFFSMEWPRYSSFDNAKAKLLYAVTNCTDMDMDATTEGRANLALGTTGGDDDD